jgi:ubiquinone/menaquinone biosynthesis C-methylase UbiE
VDLPDDVPVSVQGDETPEVCGESTSWRSWWIFARPPGHIHSQYLGGLSAYPSITSPFPSVFFWVTYELNSGAEKLTLDDHAAIQKRTHYDRFAPVYDLMEVAVEHLAFQGWRRQLWAQVEGGRVLEVGVGTGKNAPHYPQRVRVTAVDLSPRMMERARRRVRHRVPHRAQRPGIEVDLSLMDTQWLAFPDGAFDTAVATFVFCSVRDPVLGLREIARVVNPGGRVVLLEHVRVNRPVIGRLMDLFDPLVARMSGEHFTRPTVENVQKAGLEIERVEELALGGLVKLIVAQTRRG